MKVIMVGTPSCQNCKELKPQVMERCNKSNIEFSYYDLNEAPQSVLDAIKHSGFSHAPVFVVYKDDNRLVADDKSIFNELNFGG